MLDRGARLAQFPLPIFDAGFLAGVMYDLMAALILIGLMLLASGFLKRWLAADKRLPAE